jgi:hypothetical protein
MSAVAPVDDVSPAAPDLLLAPAAAPSVAEIQLKEMNRWLLWFGLPAAAMAVFVGAVFATGSEWLLGGALAFLIADICILIWLCMSSDTNGVLGPTDASAHH